jgi:DNA invertase Pin-like site-specific DNA recombinase
LKLGYARVSTLDQNLALQQDALKEAGCEKTYIEQMSGAVMDRPALREALNYARSGDTLIVWKLDRLTRSMKQLIETVEKLRLRGIGFRGLAEFERDLIHTRTSEGRERAKANGVKMGRKPKLTLRQKREAIRRRDKGNETTREIARSYNVSHSTISRLAV